MSAAAVAGILSAGVLAGGAVSASAASSAPAASAAVPATSTTSCGASNVWLKVWGGTGEHCYTGSGSLAVSLPGVHEVQVLGSHSACLVSLGRALCGTGPDVIFISPVINVTGITLIGV